MMKIENCHIDVKCNMTWDTLIETADSSIKYCPICDSGVHYCDNEEELMFAHEKGWCVAVHVTEYEDDGKEFELLGIQFPLRGL